MSKTKVIAMYLPQYHETEDNNKWWGKGFTDWISVKNADKLFENHRQPRVPLDNRYYDLSNVENIRWQAELAQKYGVYGFGIYHYWFSSQKQTLTKPAELLLENKDIDIPFFLAWDNNSWVRTWSKYKHNTNAWSPKEDLNSDKKKDDGFLAKLDYGTQKDWETHFDYLNKFFSDKRYIKVNEKPLLIIWNYTDKEHLKKMCTYWRKLAEKAGYPGLYLINRYNPYDSLDAFDALFTYEPMFSAWQNKNLILRIIDKLKMQYIKQNKAILYDYDQVWNSILNGAKRNAEKNIYFGGFVSYDDSPRRGNQGKIVLGETPEKFERYIHELLKISDTQEKEFVFLTAWNEWGEGAYLEPDKDYKYAFLEALRRASI